MNYIFAKTATIMLFTTFSLLATPTSDWLEDFVERFVQAAPAEFNIPTFWQELHACLAAGADLTTIDCDIQNYDTGVTMLYCAARLGDIALVQALLSAGAQQDVDAIFYNTPLHIAASHGHNKIIELLCQHGADVNAQNAQRQTALHRAALKGHIGVCRILLAYKADRFITDHAGKCAIDYARAREYGKIVALLS